MSFRTSVRLDSKIFKSAERRRALSVVVSKNARDFRESTKRKMRDSTPTGKVYERGGRGAGFRRSHRASARGERPAPDSGNLLRNVKSRDVSELHSVVEVDTNYADILQAAGHEIVTAEDLTEARQKLSRDADIALKSIV